MNNHTLRSSPCGQQGGFTFIELLITLALMAITFMPLMNMFITSLDELNTAGDLTTARYLAQEGMEKIKNSNFTMSQLKDQGDLWDPPLARPALEVNGQHWRIFRKLENKTDPLLIQIKVFKEEDRLHAPEQTKPIVEIATLFEDFDWSHVQ